MRPHFHGRHQLSFKEWLSSVCCSYQETRGPPLSLWAHGARRWGKPQARPAWSPRSCFSAGAKLAGEGEAQAQEGGARDQREVLLHRQQVRVTEDPRRGHVSRQLCAWFGGVIFACTYGAHTHIRACAHTESRSRLLSLSLPLDPVC